MGWKRDLAIGGLVAVLALGGCDKKFSGKIPNFDGTLNGEQVHSYTENPHMRGGYSKYEGINRIILVTKPDGSQIGYCDKGEDGTLDLVYEKAKVEQRCEISAKRWFGLDDFPTKRRNELTQEFVEYAEKINQATKHSN